MAVDENEFDVLLAASDNGKSDWVLDSGSAYHLCRDIEVFSTYAACEDVYGWRTTQLAELWQRVSPVLHGRREMQRDAGLTLVEELSEFQGKQGDAVGKKDQRAIPIGGECPDRGAPVRHGSSGISEKNGQGKQPLHKGTQSKRRGTWGSVMVPGGSGVVQERREMLWDMYKVWPDTSGTTSAGCP
ncbi:hypothetical protein Acr_08g0001590 [Actinidia rufa]|uniref:Uncharacterized protein n=1 Tax=Actinidia rufa TaxID=165716 RepID=A0A7J0EZG3_9ERIC|nr:hypothetical protein Acr_08g0001590 [Actinidia rufa]